jgi:hypothetical protein
MTCEPLTEDLGGEQLTLFAVASRVKTSAQPVEVLELPESVVDYGRSIKDSLERCGLVLSSPKTPRYCGSAGLTLYSETLPNWGIMLDGACWEVGTLAGTRKEKDSGYLPRPQASDGPKWYTVRRESAIRRFTDGRQAMTIHVVAKEKGFPDWKRYVLNPQFQEASMRWPVGWTDLKPLEMDKIQSWLQQHGGF